MPEAGAARHPRDSSVETTHVVLPPDTNQHGNAFGGIIMQWMDLAAGIAAHRHCRGQVVTAAVDGLVFARPIRLGDLVIIKACVDFAGRTSMEVGVRVEREDPGAGTREHCLSAYFTFVAIDGGGRPIATPALEPETELERKWYDAAKARRAVRLARKPAK